MSTEAFTTAGQTIEAASVPCYQWPKDADILRIQRPDGSALVTLHHDGSLTYGEGYTPDEAAKTFWDAIRRFMP
jgi:hypothetical protein